MSSTQVLSLKINWTLQMNQQDENNCITTEYYGKSTVRRIGNKLGETVSCHFQVHISDVHATKRVAYARVQKGQDH